MLAREFDVVSPAMSDVVEYESLTARPPVAVDYSSLAWWLCEEQQKTYPRLSRMAIDVVSVPAMSAEPERVCFGARRTISWDRCQLGSAIVVHEKLDQERDSKGNFLDALNALDEDINEGGGIEDMEDDTGWAGSTMESI
ncbi:hypothetical protein CRV24_008541 [Beauveria bassiana]|nr:hypothetical protein CRV24_008541 [Beauveria bassiana]KAH8716623.1 hypothetical protein HC256_005384 [Beauveria bassiana]